MAGENIECLTGFEKNSGTSLTMQEVKQITMNAENPHGIDFLKFGSFESFQASYFFQKYYDIGDQDISFSPDAQTLQRFRLDPNIAYIMHFQWILVLLGYMKPSSFSGDFCDIDPEDTSCKDTFSSWRYLGVFGKLTREQVKNFQRDFSIPLTGIVDTMTKEALYQAVYFHFHSIHKQECQQVTKEALGKIGGFLHGE